MKTKHQQVADIRTSLLLAMMNTFLSVEAKLSSRTWVRSRSSKWQRSPWGCMSEEFLEIHLLGYWENLLTRRSLSGVTVLQTTLGEMMEKAESHQVLLVALCAEGWHICSPCRSWRLVGYRTFKSKEQNLSFAASLQCPLLVKPNFTPADKGKAFKGPFPFSEPRE